MKTIDAGRLNRCVTVLKYVSGAWVRKRGIYASYTYKPKVIYSPHAAAPEGAEFVMRDCGLTMENALRLGGAHYMITGIDNSVRGAVKVSAAKVSPAFLSAARTVHTLENLNRPTDTVQQLPPFEGVIAETYAGWQRDRPEFEIRTSAVLTAPKSVTLKVGDVISYANDADRPKYAVRCVHDEQAHISDYELERLDDA